jgi:hypothetical protein
MLVCYASATLLTSFDPVLQAEYQQGIVGFQYQVFIGIDRDPGLLAKHL